MARPRGFEPLTSDLCLRRKLLFVEAQYVQCCQIQNSALCMFWIMPIQIREIVWTDSKILARSKNSQTFLKNLERHLDYGLRWGNHPYRRSLPTRSCGYQSVNGESFYAAG